MKKEELYDIIIIGAGPAGMTAAIFASGYRPGAVSEPDLAEHSKVLLLDRLDQVGRKILVTGNGRCNLTNLIQQKDCYRSETPDLAWDLLRGFDEKDLLDMMKKLGVCTRDRDGYVYPYNDQAATVREALETRLNAIPSLTIRTGQAVAELSWDKKRDLFVCRTGSTFTYLAPQVIVACGGLAGVKLGCQGDGYRFAKAFGHKLYEPLPALTALTSSAPFLKRLSGVRCRAGLNLRITDSHSNQSIIKGRNKAGSKIEKPHEDGPDITGRDKAGPVVSGCPAYEIGELQWTDYGISGVLVFNQSRFAVEALSQGKNVAAVLDFLPDLEKDEVFSLLMEYQSYCFYKDSLSLLKGLTAARLAPVLLREAKIDQDKPVSSLDREDLRRLTNALKGFTLRINGYKSFDKAQTTMGGVPLTELSRNLESFYRPGLFFAGEVIDVDGCCGGYNLQWAFTSGQRAGNASYQKYRNLI